MINEFISSPYVILLSMLCSIIGLLINIAVIIDVKSIKKFYKFKSMFPDSISDLQQIVSDISEQLNDFTEISTKTSELLVQAETRLILLSKIVKGNLKNNIDNTIQEINDINGKNKILKKIYKLFIKNNETDREKLNKIYLSIYKIIRECRIYFEEMNWEK